MNVIGQNDEGINLEWVPLPNAINASQEERNRRCVAENCLPFVGDDGEEIAGTSDFGTSIVHGPCLGWGFWVALNA